MPKISVIIPVYNVEKYIERCVRSLFEQTLDDIEYIFVDDCSKDNSIDILYSLITEYPHRSNQVTIHRMASNCGQAAVRKWGVLNSSGEYTIHCDPDDWVPTNAYEFLYKFAKEHNFDIVFHDYTVIDGTNHLYRSIGLKNKTKSEVLSRFISGTSKASLCFSLIKKQLYMSSLFVFPEGNMTEDCAMIVQLLFLSPNFGYLQEPLYFYYQNSDSITHRITFQACENKFNWCVLNTRLLENFINKNSENHYREEFCIRKLSNINQLLPALYKHNYYLLWKNSYPLLIKTLVLSNFLSFSMKVKVLITYLGLYPVYHYVKGFEFATK